MIEEKAVRGISQSLLTFAANKVITVATTIVLAHLLNPDDFGLFALTLIALSLLSMFNDFGLGFVLVSRPDLDERAKGTVLTIMIATSAVLAIALLALSGPVANLINQPRLGLLLELVAATLLISGPVWFYESLLQAGLAFRQRFVATTIQNLTFAGVAIGLTLMDDGVISLVLANVASYVVYLVALLALAPRRVRPALRRSEVRGLLGSGRGFLAQAGVVFVRQNADNLSVGEILGRAPLGAYFLAYRLAELTYAGVAVPVCNVTFPAFTRMRHRGDPWSPAFLATLRLIALAVFPIGVVVSAAASPLTRLLYGDKWLAMIGPLAILGVWSMLRPLEATLTSLLNSVGASEVAAVATALGLILLVPGLVLAATYVGLNGVAWVMVAESAFMVAILSGVLHRRAGVPVRRQWSALAPLLAPTALSWLVGHAVVGASARAPALASLAVAIPAITATYATVLWITDRAILEVALKQVRVLRRPPPATAA
jgi:PST family polysaccharide transporter